MAVGREIDRASRQRGEGRQQIHAVAQAGVRPRFFLQFQEDAARSFQRF